MKKQFLASIGMLFCSYHAYSVTLLCKDGEIIVGRNDPLYADALFLVAISNSSVQFNQLFNEKGMFKNDEWIFDYTPFSTKSLRKFMQTHDSVVLNVNQCCKKMTKQKRKKNRPSKGCAIL